MTHAEVHSFRRPLSLALVLALLVAASLVLAPSGRAQALKPTVKLGPITVLNGVATVTGTVNVLTPINARLTINGHPIGLKTDGTFVANLDVTGQSALVLEVTNPLTGDRSTVSIPLTSIVGPGGVVPGNVVTAIERALITILEPLGGFVSLGGEPIRVEGSVGNRDQLVGLTVNGVDVLGALRPDGGFSILVPGTSTTVTVVATSPEGASSTTTYPVAQPAAAAPAVRTVTVAQAAGVRVASVRYIAKSFRKTKRLRMIVTVKDRLGRAIRGASVQVRGATPKGLKRKTKLKKTGKLGRTSFLVYPRPRMFGKRLFTVTVAKTKTAKAQRKTSVRVPKLRARPSARSGR
jgi:hypothetical protein